MADTIEFFWDTSSPYTYLAATQLDAFAARNNVDVQWRPFLIGGVFKATGNRMPASIPAKGRNLKKDLGRWAARYDVPFVFPQLFPMNSLFAQRLACAALDRQTAQPPSRLPLALMKAYWVEGRDLSQPEELTRVCAALGFDAEALLAAAQQAQAKNRLRVNTEEAVERGAFGAPTFFWGEHMFWGNHNLNVLEACLKGDIPA